MLNATLPLMANEMAFYMNDELAFKREKEKEREKGRMPGVVETYQEFSAVRHECEERDTKKLFIDFDIFKNNINSVDQDF